MPFLQKFLFEEMLSHLIEAAAPESISAAPIAA